MKSIEQTIEVERPVSAVYDQWTRFQDFPQFMMGIEEVRLLDPKHLCWRATVRGKIKGWDAEIIEQVPDQRISWRGTSGAESSGTVIFTPLTAVRTRVMLCLTSGTKGIFENLGDNLGLVSHKIAGDLIRFKEYIESRGAPTEGGRIAETAVPAIR